MIYSDIEEIDIKDFRCLEHLHLNFRESPIICLQAGNDGGKSSTVKAIEAAMYNDNDRKSKGYIRTGSKGFEIIVKLKDGTAVQRAKGAAGNIFRIINADGSLRNEWTKLDSNIPAPVQEIFGLFVDESTGELLNIRTCESLLLFALTKPSENHKVFYSRLKVDEVSKAMEIGKGVVNQLATAIGNSTATRDSYADKLRQIKIPEMSGIEQLKERIDATSELMRGAKAVRDLRISLSNMRQSMTFEQAALAELNPISEESVMQLKELQYIIDKCNQLRLYKPQYENSRIINDIDAISFEDMELLSKFEQALAVCGQLRSLRESGAGEKLSALNELSEINETVFSELEVALSGIRKLKSLREQLDAANKELSEMQESLNNAIKESGLYFDGNDNSIVTKCSNCGEESRLQLSVIEKACSEAM